MDNAPFSEEEIMIMFANIAFSLLEVNSRGIFHRDLKPDNMLYKSSEGIDYIMLTDFGSSKY
jgi:serine/threonine protein kinase